VNAQPYRVRRVCVVCAVFALVMCSLLLHVSAVMAQDSAHDRAHDHDHVHRPAQNSEQGRTAAAVTDPRGNSASMPERAALLQLAEAALQRGDSAAAVDHFDRAALMLHAPDTEMGLVRAYMQAGEYRRALAFCAYTTGAHREAAAPGALYAWLLQAGGQHEFAKRTLSEALGRHATDPVLLQTQSALDSAQPTAGPLLASGPHRLAPFAVMQAGQADVPVSALRAALPATDFSEAPPPAVGAASTRMTADLAYERALRFSLQVIALQP
jgi:tetratricopeptide (TPR) repeat protein